MLVARDKNDNHLIGADNTLERIRRQAMIWIDDGLVYRSISSSLDLDELTH